MEQTQNDLNSQDQNTQDQVTSYEDLVRAEENLGLQMEDDSSAYSECELTVKADLRGKKNSRKTPSKQRRSYNAHKMLLSCGRLGGEVLQHVTVYINAHHSLFTSMSSFQIQGGPSERRRKEVRNRTK